MGELVVEREPQSAGRSAFDVNKPLIKLILASVLLNALILTALVTSTPERSAASTWATIAYKARFRLAPLDPVKDRAALAQLHLDSSTASKSKCIACHGDEFDSPIVLHRIHLKSELLPGLACHDCHQRVDLTSRSNVAMTRWVDVGFCKSCHSKFPGLSPGSSMTPADYDVDCITCHSGANAFRHEPPYLSQVIAPSECKGCHGGRVLPWTSLHERSDWLQTHGAEALTVGTDNCFQCHDFGLKFCDTCHAVKPPMHLPADRWKADHPDASRADTRACYTCHKINFCKKCHVGHDAGWKELHSTFVASKGTDSCVKCHSLSFCSYCHAQSSSVATDSGPQP
jgi:hypothetical protein